jgi:hypothetical protein
MPTPGERRALIFIASIAALGVAARAWKEAHPQDTTALAGNRTALARQIEAVDSAIAVTSSKRKPRAPRTPVATRDTARSMVHRANARGRSKLAVPLDTETRDPRAIYDARSAHFDSLARGMNARSNDANTRRLPSAIRRALPEKWSTPPVDLDIAGFEEVAAVPPIGAALARRIVTSRINDGPFGSIIGLQRIPGITAAFAHRLEPFVTFSLAPRLGSAGERRTQSKSDRRSGAVSRP